MSLSERIPGMRPGSTLRNIAVGMVYLLIISAVFGGGDDTEADADEDIDSTTGDEAATTAEGEQKDSDGEDATNYPEMDADQGDAEARTSITLISRPMAMDLIPSSPRGRYSPCSRWW